jgi:hypothetical protein
MRPEQQKQKVANEQEKKLSVVMQVAAFTKKGHKKVQNMWYVRAALFNNMPAKSKCGR